MKVLVTGGAGFLGSHLVDTLVRSGNHVILIDNFVTGSRRNISTHQEDANFEVVEHDVTSPIFLEVDQIYNLACPASPVKYQFDPIQTLKTNVLGSLNMLGLARRLGVPILQASTSEVYGDASIHPQSESYWGNVNPVGVRSCYDEGKRAAEALFSDYHRMHGVAIQIPRIFNTYGPRMAINDGRVVSNFIVQALLGREISIYGDGLQTRSFCYVSDLVNGLVSVMNGTEPYAGPVNIGNPKEFSILELAQLVIEMTNSNSKLIFKPLPSDDPIQRQPDISMAQSRYKWSPSIELREGLQLTIDYFNSIDLARDMNSA